MTCEQFVFWLVGFMQGKPSKYLSEIEQDLLIKKLKSIEGVKME